MPKIVTLTRLQLLHSEMQHPWPVCKHTAVAVLAADEDTESQAGSVGCPSTDIGSDTGSFGQSLPSTAQEHPSVGMSSSPLRTAPYSPTFCSWVMDNNPKTAKWTRLQPPGQGMHFPLPTDVLSSPQGLRSALSPSGPSPPISAQESPFAGVISSLVTTITATSTPTILGGRDICDDALRGYGALCP